jgi:hypothetical protein
MAEGARVYSIDAIKTFRAALIKYSEAGNVAITSADSDVDRMMGWLERDQAMYWQMELRKRHEYVMRCEDAVRQKTLSKNVDGTAKSAVDELKALQAAKRKREEAEQKILAVKKAIQMLRKESMMYKGRVQKFATAIQTDLPAAVHWIDNRLDHLAAYLAVQTAGEGISLGGSAEQIARAGASARVGLDKFRDQTPKPERRSAAPLAAVDADHPIRQPWGVSPLQDWQLKAIAGLGIEPQHPDPDTRIVIAPGVWTAPRVYLERLEPINDSDSGWYIGPAGETPLAEDAELIAVRAGDLVAARPDWVELLQKPTGTLIVLDAGGPAAMFDPLGLDVWSIALIKAEEPPAEAAPAAGEADEPAPAEAKG